MSATKCKVRQCASKRTLLCIVCGQPVCHHCSKGWPAGKPVCGACRLRPPTKERDEGDQR